MPNNTKGGIAAKATIVSFAIGSFYLALLAVAPAKATVNSNGINSNGINSNGINSNGINSNGINSNGINSNGINSNGINSNGVIVNGINSNGINSNGINSNGINSNGIPGLNLENLEHSLVFGNLAVHNALLTMPFTASALSTPGNGPGDPHSDLYQVWSDPFSIQVVQYLWSDAHAPGDDFHYDPCDRSQPGSFGKTHADAPASCPVSFYGALGLCDRGAVCAGTLGADGLPVSRTPGQSCRAAGAPRGWVADQPLSNDLVCQHQLSAVFMAQINSLGIHNLISFAAPPVAPARDTLAVRSQLATTSASIPAFPFKFGTELPVDAFALCDPSAHQGPVNCGWAVGNAGACSPGAVVMVSVTSSTNVPLILQIQQGVHGLNYPFSPGGQCSAGDAYCATGDFLGAVPLITPGSNPALSAGAVAPTVTFTCPPSGVFSVQWAPWERLDYANLTAGVSFSVTGGQLPAPEVAVFPRANLEAYWAGNIFGAANLNSAVATCEVRAPQAICGAATVSPNACTSAPSSFWLAPAQTGVDQNAYQLCATDRLSCALPHDPAFFNMCGDGARGLATRCQTGTTGCCVPCATESFDLLSQTTGETALLAEVQHSVHDSVWFNAIAENPLVIGGHFGPYSFTDAASRDAMPYTIGTSAMSLAKIVVNTTQRDFVLDTIELDGAVTSWSNVVDVVSTNVLSGPMADARGYASALVMVLPVTPGAVAPGNDPVVTDDRLALNGYTFLCQYSTPGCYRGPTTQALVPDYRAPPIALGFLQNNADDVASCAGDTCRQRVNLMSLDHFQAQGIQPSGLSQNVDRIQAIGPGEAVAIVIVPFVGNAGDPFTAWGPIDGSNPSAPRLRTGASVALKATTTVPSTLSNLTSPPYYTGTYVSHFATAAFSGQNLALPGSTVPIDDAPGFDPGPFAVRPEQLHVVVSGHSPAAPGIAFPNAHLWLSKSWGDTQGYYRKRSCTSDLSTCIANFEGTIETTASNPAGCAQLSSSVDPVTGLPLGDVAGCNYGNLQGGAATPATFNDGTGAYAAYGVTTFLPNYGSGPESAVNLACQAAAAPTAVIYAPSQVCAGSSIALDASGSSDPGRNPLAFHWADGAHGVSLDGFAPTLPTTAAGSFDLTLTATNLCGKQGTATAHVDVLSNTNAPPIAGIAGASLVNGVVVLDGSSSFDPLGNPITYGWSQSDGTPVLLSDAGAQKPTFVPPAGPATLTFQLRVTNHPGSGCLVAGGALTSTAAIAQLSFSGSGGAPTFVPVTATPPGAPVLAFVSPPAGASLGALTTFSVSAAPDPGSISATCNGAAAQVFGTSSPYSFSCTFLTTGTATVTASAVDSYGRSASASAHVNVTEPPPLVSTPADLSVAAEGPSGTAVHFVATATSALGNPLNVSCSPASDSTFPVNTGATDSTTVTCSATSTGGTTTQTFHVRVFDDVPPVFAATPPPNLPSRDGVFYARNPNPAFWLGTPIASDNVGLDSAGSQIIDTFGGVSTARPTWQLGTFLLAEGLHLLVFSATDTSGNRTYSTATSVQVDYTAPGITVLKPTPNEQFGVATVTAQASVLDASPVAVSINGFATALDSNRVATAQLTFATSGQQNVSIVATDLAGNVSTTSVALTIDLASPMISFTVNGQPLLAGTAFGPRAGDVLPLTTRVDSTASGSLAVSFAGAPGPVAYPAMSGLTDVESVALSEGSNPISATATSATLYDANGAPLPARQTVLVTSVLYDKTPPSGAISIPAAGSTVNGLVELTGTATDACPASMTCPPGGLTGVTAVSFSVDSGAPLAAQHSGGVWTATFDAGALGAGNHQLTMTMTDGVGNTATTAPTSFTAAGSPLTVSFSSLTDGASLPPAAFDVTADAQGTGLTRLTLANGTKSTVCNAAAPTGALSCTWANFDFGALCKGKATCPVSFTATAQDSQGHTATATLNLIVDPSLKSPLRFIATPQPGATVRGTFRLVTLQAGAGFNRVTCSANGSPVGSSTNGLLVANIDTLPMIDGPLELKCTWTDSAGRADTKTETVTIRNWQLEVEPKSLDLRGCSATAAKVALELEGSATVGTLKPAAQAGQLSVRVVNGASDYASTVVAATFVSLATGTDDRNHPLELRLSVARCALIAAAREVLSGGKRKDDDDRPLSLQLRQGSVVIDTATLHVKGN